MDFVGPFSKSNSKEYILMVVDYVPKWVETTAIQRADLKLVFNFFKKNIFNRFGIAYSVNQRWRKSICNL